MEQHPDLKGALQGLFQDYTDGYKDYDTYAAQVRALQSSYPEQFSVVQAQNTRAKEWMLNNLDFNTDQYFDDWSKAGLANVKSGNLDVPYGHEGRELMTVMGNERVRGFHGSPDWFPEAGRTFIAGDPVTEQRYAAWNMPELLRHEASHSVVDGESEGAVRQMDRFYRHHLDAKPTPSAGPLTWGQASEILNIMANVGPEHTGKDPLKIK